MDRLTPGLRSAADPEMLCVPCRAPSDCVCDRLSVPEDQEGRPKLDWAARMQRRIAVAMVRTTAWIATPRTGETRRAVEAWRPGRP